MARNIGADGTDVFRAVITITDHKTREPEVKHEGPYTSPGAAQGRVTFWSNYLAEYDDDGQRTGSRATGEVEQAYTVWLPLGAPAPQPAQDPAAIRAKAYHDAANEVATLPLPPAAMAIGGTVAEAARMALHAAAGHLWRCAKEIHPGEPEEETAPADTGRLIPLDVAECPGTCPCRARHTSEEPSK